MADFYASFEKTLGHEGGYSNDHGDPGAETFKGISRRYHPSWPGWTLIDALRQDDNFPKVLNESRPLQVLVKRFYRDLFWNPLLGDEIDRQAIADELFDTAVNMGKDRAVKFLQGALNALNRNGKLYTDLVVDGQMGSMTLMAITFYLRSDPVDLLLKLMNVLQGAHYIRRMKQSPTQEKFARGWFKRVTISRGTA